MPSLDAFTDFVKSTGSKIITGPDAILNDATKNTYMIGRMLKGTDPSMSVQSGNKLEERIQLNDSGTFEFYDPNEELDIQNVDTLVKIEANWKFATDHYSYTDQEVKLNSGDAQTYYKNLLKTKRQSCKTSIYNGMEKALWATPSAAAMEASSGKVPFSIPAMVTRDGLAPAGFTTLYGVNPTNHNGWRNQVERYNTSAIADGDTGLLQAMRRMWHKSQFIAPAGGMREYFESDRLQKMVIACNLDGISVLERLTADSNDRLVPAADIGWSAGKVVFNGIPLEYVGELDTAPINNGAAIAAGKPWFYFLNLEYLRPIFHRDEYMSEKEPMTHPRQPFTRVVWTSIYYQLMLRSRRRQGLVSPQE